MGMSVAELETSYSIAQDRDRAEMGVLGHGQGVDECSR